MLIRNKYRTKAYKEQLKTNILVFTVKYKIILYKT